MCIMCPVCGEIDKSLVEVYKVELCKQNFAMKPILPTCKLCNSEIEVKNPPIGTELIVLNGTCGSGKSTIAEELMKRYGYAVIDGDCMLQVLKYKTGSKEYNIDNSVEEVGREIDILAALGNRIVLSHIILPEDWSKYVAMFISRKLTYRHILLKPDIAKAVTRCNTRTCHNSVTPEYWIRLFHDKLAYDDVLLIDNTDLTIEETINIVKY